MLEECIRAYQGNACLLQYAYVMDMMLSLPSFNEMLHSRLLDLYCHLYSAFKAVDNLFGVGSLAVLRKYWINKVHPQLYHAMRARIYQQFRDDIQLVPAEAVPSIQGFYQQELLMNNEQLS